MARTIQQIYDSLTANYVTVMSAVGLTTNPSAWSQSNLQRLFFWVVATGMATIEQLYDQFTTVVNNIIANMKPHSTRWYALKAKAFQYGYDLIPETDQYDNSSLTPDQITSSQVIKYSAVVEQAIAQNRFGLRIKVATLNGSDLDVVPTPQLNAFIEYMQEIKDAGVGLLITTNTADSLKCSLRIFYNPLVLNNSGQRLDGQSNTPVQDAFNNYLKTGVPFNGQFVIQFLIDALQAVDGVVIPQVDSMEARYGILDYTSIDVQYTPDSGYLRFIDPDDLTITWIPQSAF